MASALIGRKVGKWKPDLVEDLKSWAPLLPDVLFRDMNRDTEYFLIGCKSVKYSYDIGTISKKMYALTILKMVVEQYNSFALKPLTLGAEKADPVGLSTRNTSHNRSRSRSRNRRLSPAQKSDAHTD